MVFKREGMSIHELYHSVTMSLGVFELIIAIGCVGISMWIAKRVFTHYLADHPERYTRFLPYVSYRLLLPLVAQLLVVAASVVWMLCLKQPAAVLQAFSTVLFWLAMSRFITAIVRQALPQGRFERQAERLMAIVCWLIFITWFTNLESVVIDWLQSITFRVGKTRLDLLTVCSAMLWVSIVMVGTLWASKVLESKLMKLSELDQSLRIVFAKLTRTVLIVVAVLIALPIMGIDLTMLSVFTGALGVGLGFGLQKIASNYVSGFIILLDRSIRLGDRLIIENRVGYVSKMTSRYVVLNGLDGSEALVPNDTLIASTVINQSYSNTRIWTSVAVTVTYSADLKKALNLLKAAAQHPRVVVEPAPNAYVTNFATNGITLELGVWVNDPENGFMGLKSDLLLAIWQAFRENGVAMPIPQAEIQVRLLKDKDSEKG